MVVGSGVCNSGGDTWLSGGGACSGAGPLVVNSEVLVGLLMPVREEVLCFLKFSIIFVVFYGYL